LPDPLAPLLLRDLLELQPEVDVVVDGEVGPQCVALEHEPEPAVLRRYEDPVLDRVHDPIADPDRSPGGVLESADHPQRRGLPTTRGTEEAHEIAVLNGQIEVVDGVRGA